MLLLSSPQGPAPGLTVTPGADGDPGPASGLTVTLTHRHC